MRVAWQAGVVRALFEDGLTFAHVDGTSGGIMNAAMLLSGLSAEEMGQRWRTLDVRRFVSLLPLSEYLKGPTNLEALGDADGVVNHVFPHLGVDVERLRAAEGMEGTFNVCNFGDKTCEAIGHRDVDVDLLVAGISLPIFMPPVRRGGATYTDAVWIKDANLTEAVRRGAEELWLVWCIGNTDRWGDGPLEQYVHMIEMSAGGALVAELAWIAELNRRRAAGEVLYGHDRPVRVHVVKPEHPLPLDPELTLGRIDATALVAMGYRDACAALAALTPEGAPLDHRATKMREPPLGVRFRERLRGRMDVGGTEADLGLDLVVEVRDAAAFGAGPSAGADVAGFVDWAPWGGPVPLRSGSFRVDEAPDGRLLVYEGRLRAGGRDLVLVATKEVRDDPGLDLVADVTTARVSVHQAGAGAGPPDVPPAGTGEVRLGVKGLSQLVRSVEPTGAHGLGDRARAVATLGRLVLGRLWDTYA